MTSDPNLYEESYTAFLAEAQDILQQIEQDLLSLRDDRTPAKINRLMRSAHTLKGAAASVELGTIKQIAHVLEDIFTALYNPDIVVDPEAEALLFQAYECLRFPLIAELTGQQTEVQEFLDRAAMIIAQLQEKWGDCFDREATIPNSTELGFDVVQSLFEAGVEQRLQELRQTIDLGDPEAVEFELRSKADIFLGLAESLNLPGFGMIAQTTLMALETHPEQAISIAELAFNDFTQGKGLVLQGDRTQGGMPSLELQALAGTEVLIVLPTRSESFETETNADAESFSLDELFSNVDLNWSVEEAEKESGEEYIEKFIEEPDEESDEKRNENETTVATELSVTHTASRIASMPVDLADSPWAESIQTSVSPAVSPRTESVESAEPARAELVRVEVEQLKHLDYLTGELLINQSKQTTQDQQLRTTMQELRSSLQKHQQTLYTLQDCVEKLMGQIEHGRLPATAFSVAGFHAATTSSSPALTSNFDVLEMEHYNDLRLLVRSALNQTVELDETAEDVDLVTKQSRRTLEQQRRSLIQVRDNLTALRMRPLQDLLNRFPRLLQQLVEAHGKPAELILKDTRVYIDKAVAEKLYDPLLHLIRNAFDHGIEPPEVRQAQGKSEIGKIEIRANQQGNQIVIEVRDDGRGIDLQRIAQRAIELNLVSREQVSTMPQSRLLDILFRPGFSTAVELSDLSGRGIGLDVVNSQLQAMNGSIAISTVLQQGTTFSLKIPLSLTTTKLLVCQTQQFIYALPVERVEQIIIPASGQLNVLNNQQLVLHWNREQEELIVPAYLLSELVNYSAISLRLATATHSKVQPTVFGSRKATIAQSPTVLLLQTMYGRRALVVDQVLGEQELVLRPLETTIAPPPYIYGCCILGSSRSALAIDVEVLMQLTTEVEALTEPCILAETPPRFEQSNISGTAPVSGQVGQTSRFKPSRTKPILVVDDSLTLRRHLTLVFEQVGYQVLQAEDGEKALAQLRQNANISLVICDIEMPNLNGFEFLSQVQRDPVLAKTPVVMLTSRSSAKHRQIALELGAAAYFTKPYDQDQLIATVEHLLKSVSA